MRVVSGVFLAILLTCPKVSFAQAPETPALPPKAFVDVNLIGTMKSAAKARQFNGRFLTFGEVGNSRVNYPAPSSASQVPDIDVGAGYMTGTLIGLGVNLSRASFDDTALLSTTVPHPLVLSTSASGDGISDRELKRDETMLALNAVAVPYRAERGEARAFLGFAYFWLSAEMVDSVLYSQTSSVTPLANAITVTGMTTSRGKGGGLGFNVGGDYTYFFTRMAGVRLGLRYSQANVHLDREPLSQIPQNVKVGGLSFFLGARFRFGN